MTYNIIQGNSAEVLKQYPDNYFDSVVCDPPYGINFLGKDWDSNTGEEEVYRQCYRVLKPGGHLLAFSAARTYHHLAMSVERSGFEIRDQIMWVYGSGFPKSQDVGRQIDKSLGFKGKQGPLKRGAERMIAAQDQNGDTHSTDGWTGKNLRPYITLPESEEAKRWSGWGNALKPAHEPIVVAQKPMKQALYKNVQEWGVGALNIDACRVGDEAIYINKLEEWSGFGQISRPNYTQSMSVGRFPANLIHDGSQEVVELFPDNCGNAAQATRTKSGETGTGNSLTRYKNAGEDNGYYDGLGSAARFFYCAKVSRGERHIGLEAPEPVKDNSPANVRDHPEWDPSIGTNAHRLAQKIREKSDGPKGNNHPTVKPVDLMRYLIKLVTPPNSRVLDPFCGSGSTGMAAVELGHEFVGIELDPRYCDIARRRIQGWIDQLDPITRSPLFGERNV